MKKYYPTVISVDVLFNEDDLSKSKVLEWLVVNQLKAEFFWRDPYKNEVDVVLPNKKLTPAEIKYGKISFEGLLAFMNKFKVSQGYVISLSQEREQEIAEKKISVLPAYKFLLRWFSQTA